MNANPKTLTGEEKRKAHAWWEQLPSQYKGNCSIWEILAMYARHILETETVHFDSDSKV
jgi:hypothetical protein